MGDDAAALAPIKLATTPPFRLGDVEVEPATRQIVRDGQSETLEPRIMQVLVALAQAGGRILSRDELIARCWDGVVVGDNAIQRAVSRVRELGLTFGGAFELETITKVGYRMIVRQGDPASPEAEPGRKFSLTRRHLIGAGAAAAAAGGAGMLWYRPWRHRPPPEAVELYRRAELAQRYGLGDQARQAITYFEQAVRIDPLYAEAWGGLSLAYRHILEGYGDAEIADLPTRVRTAANRALELDPDNPDAQLSLAIVRPYYRRWGEAEATLRQLVERFPRHWFVLAQNAVLLYEVGRNSEGIEFHKRVLEVDPMLPVSYSYLVKAMASIGRLQEADALLDQARERWPVHPMLWSLRFSYLVFNGRPESAAAFVMDPQSRPSDIPAEEIQSRVKLARAIQTRQPADVEPVVAEWRQYCLEDIQSAPLAASIFALLGRADLTFDSLEGYYFNRGPFRSATWRRTPYTRLYTNTLFVSPMAQVRDDPRFAQLLERVGLERYWRGGRVLPDFRRQS